MIVLVGVEPAETFEGVTVSSFDVIKMTGLTYRQLDYGIRHGLVPDAAEIGAGRVRRFTFGETVRCGLYAVLLPLCGGSAAEAVQLAAGQEWDSSVSMSRSKFDDVFVNTYMLRQSIREQFAALQGVSA